MTKKLTSRTARTAAIFLPADEREPIVGDLLESRDDERRWVSADNWIALQCVAIGAGLRVRQICEGSSVRGLGEVLRGVRIDCAQAMRCSFRRPRTLAPVVLAVLIAVATTAAAGLAISAVTSAGARSPTQGGLDWLSWP